ncbi:hypothetical protein CF327_g5091 [Tilletia walkeri]|uniref:Membrane anchor Opy2 N-terminal domain-containing protein n=1 Tax=Tilletia walkeri TaxID=117179 RepID=A0A8X7N654_9BASI|nr:hypothetical protein CF327_g5091 [Tilletia walkeri]KAE8267877.1 hypothetical protein A4X09_0g4469 [Tilletia walkeri]
MFTNCQCAYNTCVNINQPNSGGGGGSSALGGALGGVLGALAVALALFLFWRQKRQRSKLLQARVKADAKVRAAAAEKFRPGREGTAAGQQQAAGGDRRHSGNSSKRSVQGGAGSTGVHSTSATNSTNLLAPPGSAASSANQNGGAPGRTSTSDPFADPDDEDTEYTELRADGLTTFKNADVMDAEEEEMLDGLGALVNRRHSTGAATHLSRITEGNEDDDDERRSLAPTVRSSFRMSTHAPPMPADALSIAQQAAGIISGSAPQSLRPVSGLSSRSGASSSGGSGDQVGAITTATSLAPTTYATGNNSLNIPRTPTAASSNPNRLSTLTTATGISMASSIGEYVISMPQTISPEAARRVQLGQERPQMVRSLSSNSTNSTSAEGDGGGAAPPPPSIVSSGMGDVHRDDEVDSLRTR